MNPSIEELSDRYLRGELSEAEIATLEQRLSANDAERAQFRRAARLEANLRAHATEKRSEVAAWSAPQPRVEATLAESLRALLWRWLSWRPLTAAAAGIVFGMFCTSVVFAYVAPSLGKVTTLFQERFESGPAPLVDGVPIELDVWGGDYSEVVGEQSGVRPESGTKMLRFLRGDYEGRSIPSSHSSDVFRLVDVRPFMREFADGGAVVQLSAVFNAVPFSEEESFGATLTLFALDASLVGNEVVKGENVLSTESLAFSRSSKVIMDRDPATWQKVSNELRLPPGTEFLMIRMGMSNDTKAKDKPRDRFAGHFADKVQVGARAET